MAGVGDDVTNSRDVTHRQEAKYISLKFYKENKR